jgi:hypothetical protein
VTDAGLDHVVAAQVTGDRARLGGGLDNDKPAPGGAVLPSRISPAGCSPGGLPAGGGPPSRRSPAGGSSLCWHAPHLLARYPCPACVMLDQNSGSLHPCFQLSCPHPCSRRDVTLPRKYPDLHRKHPGKNPEDTGRHPNARRACGTPGGQAPCGPAHAKDTNARVFLPRGLSTPQHVTRRGPADPDRPR